MSDHHDHGPPDTSWFRIMVIMLLLSSGFVSGLIIGFVLGAAQ
jgi:hypothetical protein